MGRTLNALKWIESRGPQPSVDAARDAAAEAVPADAGTVGRQTVATVEAAPHAGSDGHGVPPRDTAAMESLLAEAEAAAAEALSETCTEPRSPWTPSTDPKARPDPLGELAESVLRATVPEKSAGFLFMSPDSDTLGIDLLVPLTMSLARRLDGDLLLVDTNLRRPALAARLGVEASRGLTDVLSGSWRWPDVVRRTVVPGVDLLPAVPFSTPAGPPPERLHLERLLVETRARYGLVLIHAASLRNPEVAPLARHCDGVYLVVRLHATTRRAAMEAGPLLRRAGANLRGCVVVQ